MPPVVEVIDVEGYKFTLLHISLANQSKVRVPLEETFAADSFFFFFFLRKSTVPLHQVSLKKKEST